VVHHMMVRMKAHTGIGNCNCRLANANSIPASGQMPSCFHHERRIDSPP